jgi:hypothetical protein
LKLGARKHNGYEARGCKGNAAAGRKKKAHWSSLMVDVNVTWVRGQVEDMTAGDAAGCSRDRHLER